MLEEELNNQETQIQEEAELELNEVDVDQVADTAIESLQGILQFFNLGDLRIDEYDGEEGELILDITGEDLAVLIGRHGKTLDALQFLVSSITARKMGVRYPIVVDVESYKSRQREKLENQAYRAARKAVDQKRRVSLRPMTPYERRIIHMFLREDDDVSTRSEGSGASRHVVIEPIR